MRSFASVSALLAPIALATAALTVPACSAKSSATAKADFAPLHDYLFAGDSVTEGVVVLHEGRVVYEEYDAGFEASMRHITYSASKSIGSALVGIAIGEGVMKLSDSVCKYVPAPAGSDPTLCDTTIEHVLQMSSGLKWAEDYGDDPSSSNVLIMLYGNTRDMGEYTARQPRAVKAGERWNYSSGDSNLLARALRGALGGKNMQAWAKEKLFEPAGMKSAIFETDRSGTLVFSSSCFMTPQDMARFGQLYLEDGVIDGKRVLPEGWVKYTQTPAPAVAKPSPRNPKLNPGDSGGSYGAAFWLNTAVADSPADTWTYPMAPADTYAAEGHWGQRIVIIPSRKIVIARVGNDRNKPYDSGPMIERAVAAIEKGAK